jgi:hypothetical protein
MKEKEGKEWRKSIFVSSMAMAYTIGQQCKWNSELKKKN